MQVEITAIYDMSANVAFTPVAEIDCKDANGPEECLTSNKLFANEIEADCTVNAWPRSGLTNT
jgi:hypothetical protein